MNHCLVFDIGKTNKKAFVFDEGYRIVFEKTAQFPETCDDDGAPCEDIALLEKWVVESAAEIRRDPRFQIRAANCSTYGASFVHLDAHFRPVAPLYNYLKPFPGDLLQWFLSAYGGAEKLSLETASPLLGHLNSGLQLLWLKHRKPLIFKEIKHALHLPQWVAMLLEVPPGPLNGEPSEQANSPFRGPGGTSDMTSLGCHTMLWDFRKKDYHEWAKAEGIAEKLAPISSASNPPILKAPTGLHDSSAALIPYLKTFSEEPFLLISTGTWCISLNPFNREPLTAAELAQDCLCYMTPLGQPVKAARYFGGHEHEEAVKKLAAEHDAAPDFYQNALPAGAPVFEKYAAFMRGLIEKQVVSVRLAIGGSPLRRIFVDGGFAKNALYMSLLAEAFPEMEVFAAEVPQATALGAAMAVHGLWNEKPASADLVSLRRVGAG